VLKDRVPKLILAIINAGEMGKTTLATHLAYRLACRQISRHPCSVALLGWVGSLSLFCGVKKNLLNQNNLHLSYFNRWFTRAVAFLLVPSTGSKLKYVSIQQSLLKLDELISHPSRSLHSGRQS